MSFPTVKSYASVDPITSLTVQPLGHIFRSPRVNQGPARGGWIYKFFLTGTSTPKNVYQDAALTVAFSPTGQVTADAFGRFPAIYLDNSIAYKVTLSNAVPVVQQTSDPYNPAMATTGFAQIVSAIGLVINPQGELTLTEAGAGGSGIELSITAGQGGALKIPGITPGHASIVADVTVTTGGQTATFQASNMPPTNALNQFSVTATAAPAGGAYVGGNLTANFTGPTSSLYTIVLSTGQVILGATFTTGSVAFTTPSTAIVGTPTTALVVTFSTGVAGWLPIQADGVLYYTPIFHASPFTPYVFTGSTYQGQFINGAASAGTNYLSGGPATFGGDGLVTMFGPGSTATPPQYFNPPQTGIGATTWINITQTGVGNGGQAFSAAVGAWTNITSGGLTIGVTHASGTCGKVLGTYQLSTSGGGSPVVASGTIQIAPTVDEYITPGTYTETMPSGPYTNVVIEVWAGGGEGGSGFQLGFQGGSASYGRSVYSYSGLGGAGKTFNVTVGRGGINDITGNGVASSVTAGTVAGFTSILTNPGLGNRTGGAAGSGGNSANTAGANGAQVGGNNPPTVSGTIESPATPVPWAYGGAPGFHFAMGQPGGPGHVVFAYI